MGNTVGYNARTEFFKTHFGYSDNHIGFISAEVKTEANSAPRRCCCRPVSDLGQLWALDLRPGRDYYINSNSMNSPQRGREHLFSLNNIVVDIDAHGEHVAPLLRNWHIEQLRQALQELPQLFGLPMPNTINRTGRGLQLWFALEPCAAAGKNLYMWQQAAAGLCAAVQEISTAAGLMFAVDPHSIDPAGLFRFPGSYNTAAGQWGDFEHVHGQRSALPELFATVIEEELLPARDNITPFKRHYTGDRAAAARRRAAALLRLIDCRQRAGEALTGCRDYMLFSLYMVLKGTMEHDAIMQQVEAANARFNCPLSPREINTYCGTASRRYNSGISNRWIIEHLEITEEEQNKIGLHVSARQEERAGKREQRVTRNLEICRRYRAGEALPEIAAAVGCSERTARRVLEKAGAWESPAARYDRIRAQAAQGAPVAEIAAAVGCSADTVRRALNSAQQSAGAPEAVPEITAAEPQQSTQSAEQNKTETTPRPAAEKAPGAVGAVAVPGNVVDLQEQREARQEAGEGAAQRSRKIDKIAFNYGDTGGTLKTVPGTTTAAADTPAQIAAPA